MINLYYDKSDLLLALRGFLVSMKKLVKGSKNSNNSIGESMKNYKAEYLEINKRLEELEKALLKYSNKLKSEARFELVYNRENRASTLEEAAIGIDRIIGCHFPTAKGIMPGGFMYSTSFRPAIMWEANKH